MSPYPRRVEVVFGGGLWPLGQKVGFVELELAVAIEVVDGLVARAELYTAEADALASIAAG